MNEESLSRLVEKRKQPGAAYEALRGRTRPATAIPQRQFLMIAADHPGRGAFAAGSNRFAMADRFDLLTRIETALSVEGVSGYLGTADTVEDLALLGALEGKWVFGSMNRGGILGADWELDDRSTGYSSQGIVNAGLEGGKLLLRIDPTDPGSLSTLEWSGQIVRELGSHQKITMVEPFMSRRENGRLVNDLTTDAVVTSAAIGSALGDTSSYTWLKLPDTEDLPRLARSTTVPIVILGGEVKDDEEATLQRWSQLLQLPNVIGLVIGRSLLYPPSGDVRQAVEKAAGLLH